jgi:hypothetical protein
MGELTVKRVLEVVLGRYSEKYQNETNMIER